jgi:hypothetical protein
VVKDIMSIYVEAEVLDYTFTLRIHQGNLTSLFERKSSMTGSKP